MATITVAVSGINASDNPTPGIGIIKSLANNKNYRLFGLAYDALEPGIYLNDLIEKSFIIPYLSASKQDFIERIKYIKDSYGLDVLIPTLDGELPLFIRYQAELSEMGIELFLPSSKQFKARNKENLYELAKAADVVVPEQKVISGYSELLPAIEQIGLPVMIKGALYQAVAAHSLDEAFTACNKIVRQWGYPIIVQRLVSGEGINLVGLGDGNGELLGHASLKKLSVTELGKVWTGVSIINEPLIKAAQNFVNYSKWRGAFEFECVANEEQVSLIEINPRFPAWVYFATALGVNLPQMMMQLIEGASVNPVNEYEAGKLYIRYTQEIISDMRVFQNMVTKGET